MGKVDHLMEKHRPKTNGSVLECLGLTAAQVRRLVRKYPGEASGRDEIREIVPQSGRSLYHPHVSWTGAEHCCFLINKMGREWLDENGLGLKPGDRFRIFENKGCPDMSLKKVRDGGFKVIFQVKGNSNVTTKIQSRVMRKRIIGRRYWLMEKGRGEIDVFLRCVYKAPVNGEVQQINQAGGR